MKKVKNSRGRGRHETVATTTSEASEPSQARRSAGRAAAPRKLKYFMDGAWHESKTDKYMAVMNPSTG